HRSALRGRCLDQIQHIKASIQELNVLRSRDFCQYSGSHQDLHSFPTRRSSDLPGLDARLSAPCDQRLDGGERDHEVSQAEGDGRSEEHTSELQSLAYLVCRLLLEKKKKITLNTDTHNNRHVYL